jgi:hypothetical protein
VSNFAAQRCLIHPPQVSNFAVSGCLTRPTYALDPLTVKRLVGHSTNMDTFGTYGHDVDGELHEAAKRLDELFRDILKSEV